MSEILQIINKPLGEQSICIASTSSIFQVLGGDTQRYLGMVFIKTMGDSLQIICEGQTLKQLCKGECPYLNVPIEKVKRDMPSNLIVVT